MYHGFSIFPVHGIVNGDRCTCGNYPCGVGNKNAGKHPYTKNGLNDASSDSAIIEKMFNGRTDLNVAIATGVSSGVFVVDVDGESSLEGKEIPLTLTVSTGRGRHLYFNLPDFEVRSTTHILPDVDIRAGGGYVVAAGSTHRSGVKYISNDAPIVDAPSWLLDILREKAQKRTATVSSSYNGDGEWSFADVQRMLNCIPPDCSYTDWLNVGFGLHSAGFPCSMWDTWSRCGSKYINGDCDTRWKGFRKDEGRSIGSVVYLAQENGWLPPSYKEVYIAPQVVAAKVQELPPIGGLVGAIADWITSTAIRPQPVLSLAAALSFVGMLKGHRWCGATNLRTNLLIMSLAPSACGKEHPQYCISQLAEACGLSNNMMGKPTSGAGLLTGLKKGNGISLLNIDELGRFIGNISMKSSGGFQREIVDYIIEMFSKAGGIFRGRQYANEKENPQVVLQNPHLCCLGSTVKEKLQAACTSSEIIDGFLNRWIVFSVDERPEEVTGRRNVKVPEELIERVRDMVSYVPELKEMRMERGAFECLKAFKAAMIIKMDKEAYPINQLYTRSGEHVEKIAMTIAEGEIISLNDVENAIKLVEQSNLNICGFTGLISDTQHEADLLYILEIIKKNKKITKNQLTRQTQKINQKLRSDILSQLVESEQVAIEQIAQKTIVHWIG